MSENAELGEGEGEGRELGGRDGGKMRSGHDDLAPWRSGDCTRVLPSRLEHEKLTEDPKNNPARCITRCKEEGFQFAGVQGTSCRCGYIRRETIEGIPRSFSSGVAMCDHCQKTLFQTGVTNLVLRAPLNCVGVEDREAMSGTCSRQRVRTSVTHLSFIPISSLR